MSLVYSSQAPQRAGAMIVPSLWILFGKTIATLSPAALSLGSGLLVSHRGLRAHLRITRVSFAHILILLSSENNYTDSIRIQFAFIFKF